MAGAYIPNEYKNNFKTDGTYDYQGAMNSYVNQMNSQSSELENSYGNVNNTLKQEANLNKNNTSNQYYGNRQASAYNYKQGQLGLKELMANQGLANSGDNISANINLGNQYSSEQNKLNYEETNALSQIDMELNKAISENDLAKANKLGELRQQLLEKQMSMDTWYTEYQNTLKQQEEDKRRWEQEQEESKRRWEAEYTLSQQSLANSMSSGGSSGGYSTSSGSNQEDLGSTIYSIAYDPNDNYDGRISRLTQMKNELNAYGDSSMNSYINELISNVQNDKEMYVNSGRYAGYENRVTTATKKPTNSGGGGGGSYNARQ